MKELIRAEEAAVFVFCIYLFSVLDFAWWWFPALLLLPDIGMVGYLINSRVGAYTYNFMHHRLVAVIAALYGLSSHNAIWELIAIILFAHISFDRMLGYGLKYNSGFHHTHLGDIGRGKTKSK